MIENRGILGSGGYEPDDPSASGQSGDGMSTDRQLKALVVSQPTDYGVAVCVRQQARAAREAGHRVTVACPDSGPLRDWLHEDGVHHVTIDLKRQPGMGDVRAMLTLRRMVKEHGFDVVSLHSSKAGAVGRLAMMFLRRRMRPRVIFTPHSWSWNVGGRMASLYVALEKRLADLADSIVAVSEQEAIEGRDVLGASDARIEVIPNGVDLTSFSPYGDVADRSDDHPLIVCVGRLSRQKGQDIAIQALAQIEHTGARLRLVGDESQAGEKDRLHEIARSLGVAHLIEWTGRVDDPAPHFRAADVVVAPSRWEGMSLVFLEAMACGASLVVSDVAGSHVVESAGVVVPSEDPNTLASVLADLLADRDRREQLATQAVERARSFDLSGTLARNLALWHHTGHDTGASQTPIKP